MPPAIEAVTPGIEPAMTAVQAHIDQLRRSGTNHPHLCTRGCGALRARCPTFGTTGPAAGEGDVGIDDAQVWFVMYNFSGADSNE